MFLKSPTTEFYFNKCYHLEVGELLTTVQCTGIVSGVEKLPSKNYDRHRLKSPHWFATPPSVKILDSLTETSSELVGTGVYPTYSYVRKYLPGDAIGPHLDSTPCEINVSIKLAESRAHECPLKMPTYEDSNSTKLVYQKPGDGVIFQGCVVPHWRDEFITESEEDWQYQCNLLYVRADGPYANLKYNGRDKLNY